MVFDKEDQRKIILELLDGVTLPGKALDMLYRFKQEVIAGEVKKIIVEQNDEKVPSL